MSAQIYLFIVITAMVITAFVSFVINTKRFKEKFSNELRQDVTVEQMRIAEQKVSEFLLHNNLSPESEIINIGSALKIYKGDEDADMSEQARLSRPDGNGAMFVTFRKGLSQQEKSFIFAHECAHVINNDDLPASRPNEKNKPLVEQQADYVAAALLLPLDAVYNYLIENGYQRASSKNKVKLIRRLAEMYGVTDVIALRRVREVSMLKEV